MVQHEIFGFFENNFIVRRKILKKRKITRGIDSMHRIDHDSLGPGRKAIMSFIEYDFKLMECIGCSFYIPDSTIILVHMNIINECSETASEVLRDFKINRFGSIRNVFRISGPDIFISMKNFTSVIN